MNKNKIRQCSTSEIFAYSTGECANSLVFNGLYWFAMLYYTDALGMKPSLAGLALSLGVFWDAILDPIVGHVSDNTRCRYGRRHPYMLIGGIVMIMAFYFMWMIPSFFKSDMSLLFAYIVAINFLFRTAFAVYSIPYTALGFEMCTDYNGRTKLQGIRAVMGTLANLCGPALAWTIFFENNNGVRATNVPANFMHMGTVFTIAAGVFIVLVFFITLKYMSDTRSMHVHAKGVKGFVFDMKEIITDIYSRWVFGYFFVVLLGISVMSTLQMYLYEHFMKFSSTQKTIAHGGSMTVYAVGSLLAVMFVKRFDKKGAIVIGCVISVLCNLVLAILFLPALLKPGQIVAVGAMQVPIAFICFVIFHAIYYFGVGIMFPIATSMMADISEIHQLKSGVNKDGAYSAVFVFVAKCAMSSGMLLSGYCLTMIGFKSGNQIIQGPDVVWRLCAVTLIAGPLISVLSIPLISRYRVSKESVDKLRIESMSDNHDSA